MQGTRLAITTDVFLALENQSSKISCSGLRTHRTKMCFG